MIQKAFITQWGTVVPWSSPRLVEQDLIICRALVSIFSDTEGASCLPRRHGSAQTLSGAATPLFGRHRPGSSERRAHQGDDGPSARSPILAGRTRRQAEETQQHSRIPRPSD